MFTRVAILVSSCFPIKALILGNISQESWWHIVTMQINGICKNISKGEQHWTLIGGLSRSLMAAPVSRSDVWMDKKQSQCHGGLEAQCQAQAEAQALCQVPRGAWGLYWGRCRSSGRVPRGAWGTHWEPLQPDATHGFISTIVVIMSIISASLILNSVGNHYLSVIHLKVV